MGRPPTGMRASVNLSILVFALVVVASLTSVVSSPWLAGAAGAIVGLGISALVQRRVKHIHVAMAGPDTVAVGDRIEYMLTVTNHSDWATPPLQLVISAEGCLPITLHVEPLDRRRKNTIMVPVTAARRTDARHAVVEIHTSDALAILRRTSVGMASFGVMIHPPRVKAQEIDASGSGAVAQREQTTRPGEEFAGVRPWRRGDSSRAVNWRATARHSRLIVVERHRQRSDGVAVLVVGNPETIDDELVLANGAAAAVEVLNRRDALQVLGWTGTGISHAPMSNPKQLLTWFSQSFGIPDTGSLPRLAPWAGTVMIVATTATSAQWRAQAESQLQASGRTVVWLDAAAVDDHRRKLMEQMIEFDHLSAEMPVADPRHRVSL